MGITAILTGLQEDLKKNLNQAEYQLTEQKQPHLKAPSTSEKSGKTKVLNSASKEKGQSDNLDVMAKEEVKYIPITQAVVFGTNYSLSKDFTSKYVPLTKLYENLANQTQVFVAKRRELLEDSVLNLLHIYNKLKTEYGKAKNESTARTIFDIRTTLENVLHIPYYKTINENTIVAALAELRVEELKGEANPFIQYEKEKNNIKGDFELIKYASTKVSDLELKARVDTGLTLLNSFAVNGFPELDLIKQYKATCGAIVTRVNKEEAKSEELELLAFESKANHIPSNQVKLEKMETQFASKKEQANPELTWVDCIELMQALKAYPQHVKEFNAALRQERQRIATEIKNKKLADETLKQIYLLEFLKRGQGNQASSNSLWQDYKNFLVEEYCKQIIANRLDAAQYLFKEAQYLKAIFNFLFVGIAALFTPLVAVLPFILVPFEKLFNLPLQLLSNVLNFDWVGGIKKLVQKGIATVNKDYEIKYLMQQQNLELLKSEFKQATNAEESAVAQPVVESKMEATQDESTEKSAVAQSVDKLKTASSIVKNDVSIFDRVKNLDTGELNKEVELFKQFAGSLEHFIQQPWRTLTNLFRSKEVAHLNDLFSYINRLGGGIERLEAFYERYIKPVNDLLQKQNLDDADKKQLAYRRELAMLALGEMLAPNKAKQNFKIEDYLSSEVVNGTELKNIQKRSTFYQAIYVANKLYSFLLNELNGDLKDQEHVKQLIEAYDAVTDLVLDVDQRITKAQLINSIFEQWADKQKSIALTKLRATLGQIHAFVLALPEQNSIFEILQQEIEKPNSQISANFLQPLLRKGKQYFNRVAQDQGLEQFKIMALTSTDVDAVGSKTEGTLKYEFRHDNTILMSPQKREKRSWDFVNNARVIGLSFVVALFQGAIAGAGVLTITRSLLFLAPYALPLLGAFAALFLLQRVAAAANRTFLASLLKFLTFSTAVVGAIALSIFLNPLLFVLLVIGCSTYTNFKLFKTDARDFLLKSNLESTLKSLSVSKQRVFRFVVKPAVTATSVLMAIFVAGSTISCISTFVLTLSGATGIQALLAILALAAVNPALAVVAAAVALFGAILTFYAFYPVFLNSGMSLLKKLSLTGMRDYFESIFINKDWQYLPMSLKIEHVLNVIIRSFLIFSVGVAIPTIGAVASIFGWVNDWNATIANIAIGLKHNFVADLADAIISNVWVSQSGKVSTGLSIPMEVAFLIRGFNAVLASWFESIGKKLSNLLGISNSFTHSANNVSSTELHTDYKKGKTRVYEYFCTTNIKRIYRDMNWLKRQPDGNTLRLQNPSIDQVRIMLSNLNRTQIENVELVGLTREAMLEALKQLQSTTSLKRLTIDSPNIDIVNLLDSTIGTGNNEEAKCAQAYLRNLAPSIKEVKVASTESASIDTILNTVSTLCPFVTRKCISISSNLLNMSIPFSGKSGKVETPSMLKGNSKQDTLKIEGNNIPPAKLVLNTQRFTHSNVIELAGLTTEISAGREIIIDLSKLPQVRHLVISPGNKKEALQQFLGLILGKPNYINTLELNRVNENDINNVVNKLTELSDNKTQCKFNCLKLSHLDSEKAWLAAIAYIKTNTAITHVDLDFSVEQNPIVKKALQELGKTINGSDRKLSISLPYSHKSFAQQIANDPHSHVLPFVAAFEQMMFYFALALNVLGNMLASLKGAVKSFDNYEPSWFGGDARIYLNYSAVGIALSLQSYALNDFGNTSLQTVEVTPVLPETTALDVVAETNRTSVLQVQGKEEGEKKQKQSKMPTNDQGILREKVDKPISAGITSTQYASAFFNKQPKVPINFDTRCKQNASFMQPLTPGISDSPINATQEKRGVNLHTSSSGENIQLPPGTPISPTNTSIAMGGIGD